MNPTDKTLARVIAALLILTTLMGMVDAYVAAPVLRGPVADIQEQSTAVLAGAVLRVLMAIGVVGIALAFLPVVRRHSEIVAMSYLAFRTAECVLLSLGVCGHLFLLDVSRTHARTGEPDGVLLDVLADGALGVTLTSYQISMTMLGISSVLLCLVLLRTRLVPVWIACLGLLGYLLLLASAILDLVGAVDTTSTGGLFYVAGGLFEILALPAWLWFRGFRGESTSPIAQRYSAMRPADAPSSSSGL